MIVGKKACSIDHTCTLPLKGLTIAQRREEAMPNDSPNNYRLASVVVAKKQDH